VKYLLDTNVVSETSKRRPDARVLEWLAQTTIAECAISAVTIGEIRRGIELVKDDARRSSLESWYQSRVRVTFSGRTLALDEDVMEIWGERTAALSSQGLNVEPFDGLIAATAMAHGLTVVTRNTDHFEHFGITLLSPWIP
jgi:predicted nucleic acid-binding protein